MKKNYSVTKAKEKNSTLEHNQHIPKSLEKNINASSIVALHLVILFSKPMEFYGTLSTTL